MKDPGLLMGKEPTLGRVIRTLCGGFAGCIVGVLIYSYGFHFQGIVLGICCCLCGAIIGWLVDSLWQLIWVSLVSTIGAVIFLPIALVFGSLYVRVQSTVNLFTGSKNKPKTKSKIASTPAVESEVEAAMQTNAVTAEAVTAEAVTAEAVTPDTAVVEHASPPKIKKYRPLPSTPEDERVLGLLNSGVPSQRLAAEFQMLAYSKNHKRRIIAFVLSTLITIGFGAWLWFNFDTTGYRGWEHHEVIGPFVVSCFCCTSIILLSCLLEDYWKRSLLALLGCLVVSGLITLGFTFVPRSWPWPYIMALWLAAASGGWLFYYPICDLKMYRAEGEYLKRFEEDFDDEQ